jgi:hypothetical protein
MENISKQKIDEIGKSCDDLYKLHKESISWVENNLKFEEKTNLKLLLKKQKAEIPKLIDSLNNKPVFAIFGISQVGKSYLVQNLLSVNAQPLTIKSNNENIDFLKEINPRGSGAESTGVVTRFSIENTSLNNDFPFKARLLTPKDIVIILADAFFSDVSRLDVYTKGSDFKQVIDEMGRKYESSGPVQNFLTEDHIWDMAKYFKTNFNKFSHYVSEIENSGYWMELGQIIEKVPQSEWYKLFEPIWYNNDKLTFVFKRLISALEIINFSKIVYVDKQAVLRESGAILDVQKLDEILDASKEFTILSEGNSLKKIEISLLSALTAELTLTLDPKLAEQKIFLKNTDLLDFPGARTRESFLISQINNESVVKMFLRGKISYLFNKYSSDFEINNLMFCMKDEKIEVNELAGLVNDWIGVNIGRNAEERQKTIGGLPSSPLFVVLTFFNRQLEYSGINDDTDVSYKWDNRFVRFFEEQITFKYKWHKDWTKTQPNFSNFFLLRDYKFSNDIFVSSEKGIEESIKPERQLHWENLKNTFVNHQFVQQHFTSPELTWTKSATPNQDGSELIINALLPAANNYVKIKNFSEILISSSNTIKKELEKYLVNDDLNKKRDAAFREATQLGLALMSLFASPKFNFSQLLNEMSLSDIEVYKLLHANFLGSSTIKEPEQYTLFRAMFPEISPEKSNQENLEIIAKKLLVSSIEEAEQHLKNHNIDLEIALENRVYSSASRLVDSILEMWKKKLDVKKFSKYIELGIKQADLDNFFNKLIETFNSLNIRSELITLFEQKTKLMHIPADTEEYLASITTNYINDFISNFGYNFMSKERLQELFKLCERYEIDVSILRNERILVYENALKKIYDNADSLIASPQPVIDNVKLYFIKMKLAVISNCGFAKYNIESNNQLKDILNRLKSLNFQIS